MAIEIGKASTIQATSIVTIPDFISIGGKAAVSASFDFSSCPAELQPMILQFIEKSQLALPLM